MSKSPKVTQRDKRSEVDKEACARMNLQNPTPIGGVDKEVCARMSLQNPTPIGDQSKKNSTTLPANQSESFGKCMVVKCGKPTAKFYPERVKASGLKLGRCIRFREKWVTPSEFESMSAIQARKWKQSIKYDGKPIGEWLATNEEVLDSQKGTESSTNPDNSGLQSLTMNMTTLVGEKQACYNRIV